MVMEVEVEDVSNIWFDAEPQPIGRAFLGKRCSGVRRVKVKQIAETEALMCLITNLGSSAVVNSARGSWH